MDMQRRGFASTILCMAGISVSGCIDNDDRPDEGGSETVSTSGADSEQSESTNDSNSIGNEYIQIAESENPIQTAESFGINHDNNAVEAQITFVDENTDHMPDGITEINTMHENQAVGFINVNSIFDVYESESVTEISRVNKAITEGGE